MKRWRHYRKDTAILLSAFGTVLARERYEGLREDVQKRFPDHAVFLSFSSRTVLNRLEEQGLHYRTLAESLACLDREGYRRIVVSSINLFPTDEHEVLLKTVDGFLAFSPSSIRSTLPIFSRTKSVNAILSSLDREIRATLEADLYLYVAHGSPYLNQSGVSAYLYARDLLQSLSSRNTMCTIEGVFPCSLMEGGLQERLQSITSISASGRRPTVAIVPLLLASGVHFDEDIQQTKQSLVARADVVVAGSTEGSEVFHLLERGEIRNAIAAEIDLQLRQFP